MPLVVRIARCSGTELPHPARLHALLRQSSCTSDHDKLLRWWEHLTPPELHIDTTPGGAISFVWNDVDASCDQLRAVRDLVRRVPGRNIPEWREWSVLNHTSDDATGNRYQPTDLLAEMALRIATPGFTDALESARENGIGMWEEMAVVQPYRRTETPRPALSGHGEILPFRFPHGVAVDGGECGAVAARFRDAVLARVPDPLPAEVSGHGVNGKPHVAYIPLPDAGQPRSRADLTGVAVILPRDPGEWAGTVRASLLERPLWLPVGSVRMDLTPADDDDPLACRHPEHWFGPACTWSTVTPMVLDRFPGKSGERGEIAKSCVRLGLPEPSTVEVSREPLVRSGARLRRRQLARRDNRPFTHVRIHFPTPVAGPVLLGAQRHVGMGLCQPETEQSRL